MTAALTAAPARLPDPTGLPDLTAPPPADLVVGFDDSRQARAALGWALANAERTGRVTRVVTVYGPGSGQRFGLTSDPGGAVLTRAGLRVAVERGWALVDAAVAMSHRASPEIDITADAVPGDPRRALREAAGPDGIIVVGEDRDPGSDGSSVGSTSAWLAAHCRRATVVVRGARDARP